MLCNKREFCQTLHLIFIQPSFQREVNFFYGSFMPEIGIPDGALYGAIASVVPFADDQPRDKLVYGHGFFLAGFQTCFKCVKHALQTQLRHFF
jgi:hypothetical protein